MSTQPPEIVPICSDQPFWLESRAVEVPQPEGSTEKVWVWKYSRVEKPTLGFCIQARTIDPIEFEQTRKMEADARMSFLVQNTICGCSHRGIVMPATAVPPHRAAEVAAEVYSLSATGVDPFGEPPVASPA